MSDIAHAYLQMCKFTTHKALRRLHNIHETCSAQCRTGCEGRMRILSFRTDGIGLAASCQPYHHGVENSTYVPLLTNHCVRLPLCCRAILEYSTPHQQHWVDSVQTSPSNHLLVIHRRLPNRLSLYFILWWQDTVNF